MNNDTKKLATDLLAGWLTAIGQQNKAINRKNKLINRLRREAEEREQYLATLKREFNQHNTALHTLATAMDVKWGGSVRTSVDKAIARIAQLSAEHADMVKRNALLRERPDLPVDRIPAHDELERLQQGLRVGDHVRVTMPDGEDVYGVITESCVAEPLPVFTSTVEAEPGVVYATSVVDMAATPEYLTASTAVQEVDELAAAESALGMWLSAAMDDPKTCPEMKRDVTRWFTAIEKKYKGRDEHYPTEFAYEQACKALEAHRKRADKAEERVKEIQAKNSILYTRFQRHREDINRIRELVERIT